MTSDEPSLASTASLYRSEPTAGQVIGRYTLLEKIEEGGMGAVWAAKQSEPVKRKVALKFTIRRLDSSSVLGRFELERQALALMDHPNIAKVFDGGLTEWHSRGHPLEPEDGTVAEH